MFFLAEQQGQAEKKNHKEKTGLLNPVRGFEQLKTRAGFGSILLLDVDKSIYFWVRFYPLLKIEAGRSFSLGYHRISSKSC